MSSQIDDYINFNKRPRLDDIDRTEDVSRLVNSLSKQIAEYEKKFVQQEEVINSFKEKEKEKNNTIVIVTKYGKKFHTRKCGNMKYMEKVHISIAKSRSLVPCKNCAYHLA